MRHSFFIFCSLSSLTLLISCANPMSGQQESIPVRAEVLHSSLLCGEDIPQPLAIWISDQTELERRFQYFNAETDDAVFAPRLDFSRSGALLIAMGPQPSSGYLLNFIPEQDKVWLAGSTLVISVDWNTPEPDSMQAQVITSPCLLLHLDKHPFTSVKVLDQHGEVKLETNL